ncbi:hypothetical protein D3C84_1252030 [compost metagenome]
MINWSADTVVTVPVTVGVSTRCSAVKCTCTGRPGRSLLAINGSKRAVIAIGASSGTTCIRVWPA